MMADSTEAFRRRSVVVLNSEIESSDKDQERKRLEEEHGQVWNTEELSKDFTVKGFMAPFVVAVRKEDNVKGSLLFQNFPRFYWGFKPV